jgi:hypothetical protein
MSGDDGRVGGVRFFKLDLEAKLIRLSGCLISKKRLPHIFSFYVRLFPKRRFPKQLSPKIAKATFPENNFSQKLQKRLFPKWLVPIQLFPQTT